MSEYILEAVDVIKHYKQYDQVVYACNRASLKVKDGEFVAIDRYVKHIAKEVYRESLATWCRCCRSCLRDNILNNRYGILRLWQRLRYLLRSLLCNLWFRRYVRDRCRYCLVGITVVPAFFQILRKVGIYLILKILILLSALSFIRLIVGL